jgi:hypothetical protein
MTESKHQQIHVRNPFSAIDSPEVETVVGLDAETLGPKRFSHEEYWVDAFDHAAPPISP